MEMFGTNGVYNDDLIESIRSTLSKANIDLYAIAKSIENSTGEDNVVDLEDDLLIDNYQRHSDKDEIALATKAVIKIIKNFDIRSYGSATIAQTEAGELYVIDGAHRLIVARVVGALKAKVDYQPVDDAADAAKLFGQINGGRRSVSTHSKARAKSTMDDQSVERQLEDYLATKGKRIASKDVSSISMVRAMVKEYKGFDAFVAGAEQFETIWPDTKLETEVVYGLVKINDLHNPCTDTLNEALKEEFKSGKHFLNSVEVTKTKGHTHGANRVDQMVKDMTKLYNAYCDDNDLTSKKIGRRRARPVVASAGLEAAA